jgi:hypothetical protein
MSLLCFQVHWQPRLCGSEAQTDALGHLGARNKRWKRPANIYIGTAKRNTLTRVASLALGTCLSTNRDGTR